MDEREAARGDRRVFVKLPGPRYSSDRELLRQARARVERLERTAGELAGQSRFNVWEIKCIKDSDCGGLRR